MFFSVQMWRLKVSDRNFEFCSLASWPVLIQVGERFVLIKAYIYGFIIKLFLKPEGIHKEQTYRIMLYPTRLPGRCFASKLLGYGLSTI